MPPKMVMARISPEKTGLTRSAEMNSLRKANRQPPSPVTVAEIVKAASDSPKVYSFNCLSYRIDTDDKPDFSEWPALFTDDDEGETIHGWVIKRVGRDSDLRGGCEDFRFYYDVWGFFGFSHDDDTSNANNSDNLFAEIVENVAAAFNQGDGNGQILINGTNAQHFGLQFDVLTVLRAGDKFLHFAGGSLEIVYTT
jgi:hypothetical protein